MSTEQSTAHSVSDLDRSAALALFASLSPQDQREVISLAAAALTSRR